MQPGLRRVGEVDQPVLAALFADAFDDDPFFRWLYPGLDYRVRALEYFELVCARLLPRATALLADDGVAGSLWMPAGEPVARLDDMAALAALLETQLGERAASALAAIGAAAPYLPVELHATCVYVAVLPRARGMGLGERLMRVTLDDLDAGGVGAYLTSTNERNLTFYRRLGFAQLAEVPIATGGPVLRPMWRPAADRY